MALRPGLTLAVVAALTSASAPVWGSGSDQQPILDPREFTILFDRGSTDLTSQARSVVRDFASGLTTVKATRISLRGHADTLGSAAYNLDLSRRRAEAVRDALIAEGVAVDIEVEGLGDTDPMRATDDEVAEPLNRRVTITTRP